MRATQRETTPSQQQVKLQLLNRFQRELGCSASHGCPPQSVSAVGMIISQQAHLYDLPPGETVQTVYLESVGINRQICSLIQS